MNKSGIEWCDHTWNPITGCRHGCSYCYADKMSLRFCGNMKRNMVQTDQYRMEGDLFVLDKPFMNEDGKPVIYPFGFEPTLHIYRYDTLDKLKQFICCFTKQAQPDFKGILMDSTMILFDAKHTDKDKISRDVVTAEQQACFERYMKLGAMCFLVVSLEFKEFYRVPWVVFRDMKKIYGHKYMNREELEPYRIKYSNGVVKYLDGIVLRERNEDESTEV